MEPDFQADRDKPGDPEPSDASCSDRNDSVLRFRVLVIMVLHVGNCFTVVLQEYSQTFCMGYRICCVDDLLCWMQHAILSGQCQLQLLTRRKGPTRLEEFMTKTDYEGQLYSQKGLAKQDHLESNAHHICAQVYPEARSMPLGPLPSSNPRLQLPQAPNTM